MREAGAAWPLQQTTGTCCNIRELPVGLKHLLLHGRVAQYFCESKSGVYVCVRVCLSVRECVSECVRTGVGECLCNASQPNTRAACACLPCSTRTAKFILRHLGVHAQDGALKVFALERGA